MAVRGSSTKGHHVSQVLVLEGQQGACIDGRPQVPSYIICLLKCYLQSPHVTQSIATVLGCSNASGKTLVTPTFHHDLPCCRLNFHCQKETETTGKYDNTVLLH